MDVVEKFWCRCRLSCSRLCASLNARGFSTPHKTLMLPLVLLLRVAGVSERPPHLGVTQLQSLPDCQVQFPPLICRKHTSTRLEVTIKCNLQQRENERVRQVVKLLSFVKPRPRFRTAAKQVAKMPSSKPLTYRSSFLTPFVRFVTKFPA